MTRQQNDRMTLAAIPLRTRARKPTTRNSASAVRVPTVIPYEGPPLTLGDELNERGTDLGVGRNWRGVHWRSDAAMSLPHAEEIAFVILRDERPTFVEPFNGFQLSRYDGSSVTL